MCVGLMAPVDPQTADIYSPGDRTSDLLGAVIARFLDKPYSTRSVAGGVGSCAIAETDLITRRDNE